ncbi:MAG: beta-L-arabinofuranosidase domain-containing protein [Terriglobales bacterium]
MADFSRRGFLSGAAAALGAVAAAPSLAKALTTAAAAPAVGRALRERVELLAEPFPLAQVRLHDSAFLSAAKVNDAYLQSLPAESLAHMFRLTAGLPSSAQPLSGWEAPQCQLRGHFAGGHYLSSCGQRYSMLGEEAVKQQGEALVAELATCQKQHGNGYVSAFPEKLFDLLESDKPVWAPFYTIHKIMAGNLDMYTHCGSQQALEVAAGLGDWTGHWIKDMGEPQLQRILQTEFGGMEESLYNLAALTGERKYEATARRFEKKVFFDPLAAHRDDLKGLHANTHIPQVIGAARRYELSGEPRYHEIAHYFWHEITGERCYAPGGTGYGEHWYADAGQLGKTLSRYNMECCCGYNMLKLTRHLYTWTADPRYFDYYERTLWNSRLGTQHPGDGGKMYYFPLQTGWWKYFSSPRSSFWCCDGTGAEEFSKFANSIYFRKDNTLFVNLFIPSELRWPEKGLTLTQKTTLPDGDTTTLKVQTERPVKLALNLRIPAWTAAGGSVSINGRRLEAFAAPGSYLTVENTWHAGDTITLKLPMTLRAEPLRGDRSQQAATYGPLVLAARLGRDGLTRAMQYDAAHAPSGPYGGTELAATSGHRAGKTAIQLAHGEDAESATWVRNTSNLQFETVGQSTAMELIPLHNVLDERYGVYWQVRRGS